MAEVLNDEAQVGAVGASLRYGDGRFQHGAFRFPGPAQVALDIAPIARMPAGARLYASGLNGRYPEQAWQGQRPFDVDFVLGAALMARAETLRQVGGLDEGFFMYCEEMDWCMRARGAGWRIMAAPAAHIVHHEGQSSAQVRWPMYAQLWRSRLRFYDKHREAYGPLARWVIRGMIMAGMAWGSRVALQRFARGDLSGLEAGEELQARRAVAAEL
jgi:GT2 family glycosyltransferase